MNQRCAGTKLNGAHRGHPCYGVAVHVARGRAYCAAHYVTAVKEPSRFREALETAVRRDARQEAARRARAAQVDAFATTIDHHPV